MLLPPAACAQPCLTKQGSWPWSGEWLGVELLQGLVAVGAAAKGSVLSPQVVYSTTASVPKVETVKPANNKDDDIDIDAI